MNQPVSRKILLTIAAGILGILILASCSPAATPMPTSEEVEATGIPSQPLQTPTLAPTATPNIMPQPTVVTVEPTAELRVVELEWPAMLRLGDSDVIKLALIPSADGYTAKAEYEEHTVISQDITVKRPEGYTLSASARLDGAGFEISPTGDQRYIVQPGEAITWRWSLSPLSPGKQRVSILLKLRWEPDAGMQGQVKESLVFDRSLDIRVISFLGLRKPETFALGFSGLAFSCVLGIWAWRSKRKIPGIHLQLGKPDSNLSVETSSNIVLNQEELRLMQSLFRKYRRLILQREFMSGYSGARTFLARPVKYNEQSDAETIIKIGPYRDIEAEYNHYETYVKDRLPPITARIQNPPVILRGGIKAALQYTCIAEPGKSPVSLRQALLEQADPAHIRRLFDTFGPYWWMQRQPYTFRLEQEYGRLLPPHLVLEPAAGPAKLMLHPEDDPSALRLKPGDVVTVPAFKRYEVRADGKSLTLFGTPVPGKPLLRVRWKHLQPPSGTNARVVALRNDLLEQYVNGMDLLGLPDPLPKVEAWLQEVVTGTRSVIHGDLNLENILVGPGNLLWLIDFAQTREGHPLFDFSHLASELIAHILVEKVPTPQEYLDLLQDRSDPLLSAVENIASACQFDSKDLREYHRALALACVGSLKYQNLSRQAKHYLYLTAAFYVS